MDIKTDNAVYSEDHSGRSARVPVLKTADQYHAWCTRVTDKCWALTGKDITLLSDDLCQKAMTAALESPNYDQANWVGKCWITITGSLHDDLLIKVAHVSRGHIKTLLAEISAALLVSSAEDVQPLRLELYGATMQKEGECNLQTFIAYLLQRTKKLAFHKKPVDDEELISIFLKGLHPIFQPLQVHFAIPGTLPKKFDEVVEIVRKYSVTPAVAPELAKLLATGVSQHMFPVATQFPKPVCRQFSSKGSCRYGSACRFQHTATPNQPQAAGAPANAGRVFLKCAFCNNKGHLIGECNKRQAQLNSVASASGLAPANVHVAAAALPQPAPTVAQSAPAENPFSFVLTLASGQNIQNWVLDSAMQLLTKLTARIFRIATFKLLQLDQPSPSNARAQLSFKRWMKRAMFTKSLLPIV